MPATATTADGVTRVDLAELIALRARAARPHIAAATVRTPQTGGHVAALRGRGMDYAESRVYQAGDDARNIDWRRTARSGKWHTKLFQVERERSVLMLVDTHATMRFGTRVRYKSVAAARAAAWLAWTCIRAGDRVGAMAFGDVRGAVDPQGGARGALAVLGALAHWDAQAVRASSDASDLLSAALGHVRRVAPHGSRVWVLTDGWCTDDPTPSALTRMARRVDVRVVVVADALELTPAPAGSYLIETAAGKRRVDLAGAAARTRFRDALAAGRRRLVDACATAGVVTATLSTGDEPDVVLAPMWRARAGRR